MKSSENAAHSVYEFGDFVLDRRHLRRRDGTVIPLSARLHETLRFLVEHNDVLLDKEEIMEAVWPDSIVEENNLAQAVSKLRQVFGEKPGAPEFIVTVPRRGYRFAAPVRKIDGDTPAARPAILPSAPAARQQWGPIAATIATGGALLLGVVLLFAWQRPSAEKAADSTGAMSGKSIALLPFANLSSDKADAFFAEGMQDDILTSLGKIKDLKVIARASTIDYRATPSAAKLREIGRALGATHVLEGSVRRVSDRVVLNVSLIDTRDNHQVWSERYDRTLTDILSVQSELAVTIARELRASLSPAENAVAATKLTQNPDAYLFYLRGREAEFGFHGAPSLEQAIGFYQRAIDLDPAFALARARLAICAAHALREQGNPDMRIKTRAQAEEARRLQPQLGEAHLAMALRYLWGEDDPSRAQVELDRASELLPNSAEVPLVSAFIHKLNNRYAERLAALERAESLDPRNRRVLLLTAITHRWMRNPAEAIRAFDRIAVILGDADHSLAWNRALDEFRLTSDIAPLDRVIANEMSNPAASPARWLPFARYLTAMLKRDFTAATEALASIPPAEFADIDSAGPKSFHEALLLVARDGRSGETDNAFVSARDECQTLLASVPAFGPEEGLSSLRGSRVRHTEHLRMVLALLDAFLGRKDEAIARATEAINRSNNPPGSVEYHRLQSALALVHARVGNSDQAIDLIEKLLQLPTELPSAAIFHVTPADLKWSWVWDPLRKNPRFQKLLPP